jgi:tetratricopeptide (TPR) repeat protein
MPTQKMVVQACQRTPFLINLTLLPMNTGLIIRACVLGLVVLALMAAWHLIQEADDGVKLIFFILVGAGGGFWAIKVFIPWVGDTLGTFFYSSGEEIQIDDAMRAAAKVAQGDYEGAIEEYEKLAKAHPEDPHPVAEIAKIHSDRFHDHPAAIQVLQRHLESREWPVDDAAFLMFRMAEVYAEKMADYDAAHTLLEEVIANFPNTRHSANAHHRINEVDQAKFKQVMDQRLKSNRPAD